MLHRALQVFPWATAPSAGEPGDLPEGHGADLVMLAPVTPERLFASWEITWVTRNHLLEVLGEEVLSLCRLVLRLHAEPPGSEPWLEVDVSGPSRSRYLELEAPPRTLWGELGCLEPGGRFHALVRSDPVEIPWDRATPESDPDWPPSEEIYERVARAAGIRAEALYGPRGALAFAEGRDERLGRSSLDHEP